MLRTKLKRIDTFDEARRRIVGLYTAAFAGLPGVVVPGIDAGAQHVFHQYTLLAADREGLVAGLQQRGVGCAVHYLRPVPEQRSMRGARVQGTLPNARDVASRCVSLPMFPELSDAQVERVIDAVVAVLQDRPRASPRPLRPRGDDPAQHPIGPA